MLAHLKTNISLYKKTQFLETIETPDMDTTIVLSFEFWAFVSGLEEKKREQGRFSNHCQMSLWKDSERKGV